MSYLCISLTLILMFAIVRGPKSIAGDGIYKGELPPSLASVVRLICFIFLCYGIFFNGAMQGFFPLFEVLFALAGALGIEAHQLNKYWKQARAAKRLNSAESAVHEGEVPIPSPADLDECQERRYAELVRTGRLDDILTVCVDAMEPENKTKSFRIPRWLTNDEYKALGSVMKQRGWMVEYTMLCQYTQRPALLIYPTRRKARD